MECALRDVQAKKLAAAEAENFEAAHSAKQLEKELMGKLESLREAAGGQRNRGSGEERKRIEAELATIRAQKHAAVEKENFESAHEARQLEVVLERQLEQL